MVRGCRGIADYLQTLPIHLSQFINKQINKLINYYFISSPGYLSHWLSD